MQNNNVYDVLIVGAGPVGIFSAYQAGFLGMKSVVVDIQPVAGGQLTALYPYKYIYDIAGIPKIYAKDLVDNLLEQAKPFNPEYIFNTEVLNYTKNADNSFTVNLSNNTTLTTKVIIIAGGAGGFGPNKPPIDNIEQFEDKTLFYAVQNPKQFTNKDVLIAGGGDSAVDWAIILADIAKSVTVMHRRDNFRCAPSSVQQMKKLAEQGKINLLTPYVLCNITGSNGIINEVTVNHMLGGSKVLKPDAFLAFFGLSRTLGCLDTWGLNINKLHSSIEVTPPTYETNINGIFVVGDMAQYDHKLKLISVGFAESALAMHYAWKYVFPDKPFHFVHSTAKN